METIRLERRLPLGPVTVDYVLKIAYDGARHEGRIIVGPNILFTASGGAAALEQGGKWAEIAQKGHLNVNLVDSCP